MHEYMGRKKRRGKNAEREKPGESILLLQRKIDSFHRAPLKSLFFFKATYRKEFIYIRQN